MAKSPVVIPYTAAGVALAVADGDAAVVGSAGFISVGYDGSNFRFLQVNASGQLEVVAGAGGYGGRVEGLAASGSTPVGYPLWFGGWDGANVQAVKTDGQGRIIVAPAGTNATNKGFSFGVVVLTTVTTAVVRKTAYTEPTSAAQRSVRSSSANDTSAGTGARQVEITYLDGAGDGPFAETVTLNGTTAVNTVATNIQYIERMRVVSVGSTGSNVGIVTLYGAAGGGGGAVGTIAATDNTTLWAHHYVPNGDTCYVTGISAGHSGTTAGSLCTMFLRGKRLDLATAPDVQLSDFLTVGQNANVIRSYGTPIRVQGPTRLSMWVATGASTSITYRTSFDYYDEVA